MSPKRIAKERALALVRRGYDAMGSRYPVAQPGERQEMGLVSDLVGPLPVGSRVLDAGCGPGEPITRMLSERHWVVGVDFSEVQLRRARRLAPRAELVCQDMTRLGLADRSFDAIVCAYALISVPRDLHRAALEAFAGLLRPGGLLLVTTHLGDLPEGVEEDWLGAPMYWSGFDAETNRAMIERAGFEVIERRAVPDTLGSGAHLFFLARLARLQAGEQAGSGAGRDVAAQRGG